MTLAEKVKEAAEKAYRHGKNYLQLVDADRAAAELQPDFLEGITAELDYLVQDYILRQENGTPPAVLADLAAKEVEEYSSSIPVKKIILEALKRRRHDDGIRLYPRNKRPTAPPPPFGQDYLHHALKLAGFEAIAAHFRALAEPMEQIVPMEQQQPRKPTQWMIACYYRYLQDNDYPNYYENTPPFETAHKKVAKEWELSLKKIRDFYTLTNNPEKRTAFLQRGLKEGVQRGGQKGSTKELLEMLAPYPKALAQCRKEAGLTDDKAKP